MVLLLGLSAGPGASAQAPDGEETIYSSACFVRSNGATRGQALQVTRTQGGFSFMFQDFRDYPRAPEPAVGGIAGNKLTFEAKILGLAVRFEGTITPLEISGRLSNPENDSRYSMDVRWPKLPPRTVMPDCR
jgi:hypothetical protein